MKQDLLTGNPAPYRGVNIIMRITSYTVELKGKLSVLVKEEAVNYLDIPLNSSRAIAEMMNNIFRMNYKAEEYVYILALNTKCHPVGVFLLTKGTVDRNLVSPREIFVRLFLCGANCFVMIHNHPSGDPTPSTEDFQMTKRLKECSTLVGVNFLDHIIIGDSYFSFTDKGIL
jgi:DNA repair protein RadC